MRLKVRIDMWIYFNSSRAKQAFKLAIKEAVDRIFNEYYNEVYTHLKTSSGRAGLQKMSEDEEEYFRKIVTANAYAIIDSYGTGSKMDTDNSALEEYKTSNIWNPLRPSDNSIVGRAKGKYINIFGEQASSTGSLAGKNLEEIGIAKPRSPSFAFQNAETWFFGGNRTRKIINETLRSFINTLSNYFEYR